MIAPWIEEEIREQPAVIARFLARAEESLRAALGDRDPRGLHFVGCGDMFFAAEASAWIADAELSRPARAWRSMDLRWMAPRLTGEDLVVCASVSGRTPRTLEAALAARRAGARVAGVSDDESSPLARAVDALVPLRASPAESLAAGDYPGYQHQVAQTKTFTAALLAEVALAAYAAERSLNRLAGVPRAVAAANAAVEPAIRAGAAAWFGGRERVVVLASGPHLPFARYGAAKLLEYAIDARAQCIEEFNHLEAFVTDERSLLVLLAPDTPSAQRAAELLDAWSELGARTVIWLRRWNSSVRTPPSHAFGSRPRVAAPR